MPSPFAKKFRSLLPGQVSELTVINADGSGREVIFTVDDAIIEAPNWHPSGDFLVVRRAQCNRAQELYLARCASH